jgi:spore maturation protein CgeB
VPALYSSAKLVLSVHGVWHRAMDVPTSRLWEATACGAAVLSDPLPTAQALFEDTILWSEGGEDLRRKAEYYLAHEEERRSLAARARQLVLSRYTFDHHARRILHYLGVSGE